MFTIGSNYLFWETHFHRQAARPVEARNDVAFAWCSQCGSLGNRRSSRLLSMSIAMKSPNRRLDVNDVVKHPSTCLISTTEIIYLCPNASKSRRISFFPFPDPFRSTKFSLILTDSDTNNHRLREKTMQAGRQVNKYLPSSQRTLKFTGRLVSGKF